jgi:hypothetical protein
MIAKRAKKFKPERVLVEKNSVISQKGENVIFGGEGENLVFGHKYTLTDHYRTLGRLYS